MQWCCPSVCPSVRTPEVQNRNFKFGGNFFYVRVQLISPFSGRRTSVTWADWNFESTPIRWRLVIVTDKSEIAIAHNCQMKNIYHCWRNSIILTINKRISVYNAMNVKPFLSKYILFIQALSVAWEARKGSRISHREGESYIVAAISAADLVVEIMLIRVCLLTIL